MIPCDIAITCIGTKRVPYKLLAHLTIPDNCVVVIAKSMAVSVYYQTLGIYNTAKPPKYIKIDIYLKKYFALTVSDVDKTYIILRFIEELYRQNL